MISRGTKFKCDPEDEELFNGPVCQIEYNGADSFDQVLLKSWEPCWDIPLGNRNRLSQNKCFEIW
jgi:hypothetical protein